MTILCPVSGQNMVAAPSEEESILTSGPGSSSSNARVVCPGSVEEYFVSVNLEHAISPDQISFQWKVFGGAIEGDPDPDNLSYAYTYSEVALTGVTINNQSVINILWDENICQEAWIAVRQISEHGCVSSKWAVFHIDVDDKQAPTFDVPFDHILCEQEGDEFIVLNNLNIEALEDNCSLQDEIEVKYAIKFPDETILEGEDDVSGSGFPVGISIVTYQATDKWGNTSEQSFNVRVNPLPATTQIEYN